MTTPRTILWGVTLVVVTAAITGRVVSQDTSKAEDLWVRYAAPTVEHDLLDNSIFQNLKQNVW